MVKLVTSCAIALIVVNNQTASAFTDQLVRFKNRAEIARHEEFVAKVVSISQQHLSLPEVLRPTDLGNGLVMPADTPREHLDVFYLNPSKTIAIGILIENYSKYHLRDPRTSGTHSCSFNHERNQLLTVEPGSSEYLVVDNGGHAHRGICGTVSWQIFGENGEPILTKKFGTRLTITYRVSYGVLLEGAAPMSWNQGKVLAIHMKKNARTNMVNYRPINIFPRALRKINFAAYSATSLALMLSSSLTSLGLGSCGQCGSGRANTFSMNVIRIPLNGTHHWTTPEVMKDFWHSYHSQGKGNVRQLGGEPILGLFDKGRYLVRGQMECGCKPLLVVQFMPGPNWQKMMWAKNEKVIKALGLSNSSQGTMSTVAGIPFLVIVVGSACAAFLVLILGFCSIRKCKEARSPGYDSAPVN